MSDVSKKPCKIKPKQVFIGLGKCKLTAYLRTFLVEAIA